uniref:Myb/SANT-like DNA-binding domain-containing protein n=1 Tax=Magallana gigas TaxID=29159 RepID=A0A8W8IXR9_MAGGI
MENKKRRPNFTTEETDALREIIGNRRDFDNGKYIGEKKEKKKAWAQITLLFNNAKSSKSEQLMDKWMRMLVQNEAATGGDLTSKSASAESEDNLG